jgi:hypothetical protein
MATPAQKDPYADVSEVDPYAEFSSVHTPAAPSAVAVAPEQSGPSTLEKVGMGAAGAGAAALALKFPELRTALENLAARANIAKAEVPVWERAGLRTSENTPIARGLAGTSGREALQLHNAEVSRTIAANEAGIPASQAPVLSQDILADAKRIPSSVYDRIANALPTGPLNEKAQAAISTAGLPDTGRMSKGSPQAQAQIEDLRQQLLAPGKLFSGQQVVNELRGLRQEGFANVASVDDVSAQQLGRAQLAMSRAIQQHIADSIPAGADVTPAQFLAATKTLAKNATIQHALRGNDVDLQALARIQRAEPQLLDGGTKALADFGATHPEVATLPSDATRYDPPSTWRDFQDVSLKRPASWIRPALGNLARRSLVGDPEAAIAQANQMFPPRMPGSFSPPPAPPPPKFGGYLPSPSMINAGGGATTPTTLETLGLTPDVRAAGLQHPATARLQALRDHLQGLPERPAEPVDFQGPQKWGDFSIAPQGSAVPQEGVPFENVLEQGGTQGKPVAGIQKGYRPAPQSPKGPNMRTPPGAPELTEFTPHVPSDAQMNFRNQQAAARLRKVAGDLSLEGPGGNTGDPLERLRAALIRRERGYADGGQVRTSSSPGSPGVGGALKDAIAAVKDYFVDTPRRRLQAEREEYENRAINAEGPEGSTPSTTDNYAAGGTIIDIPQQEQSLENISRVLSDLISEHQSAPPPMTMADGGTVDDSQSSIRKVADLARRLDNPTGTDPNAEHRARVATNLASLVYGLDAQGNPAFGGRAWTQSQGGTPAGVLDALTATPHNLVQLAKLVDKYLPGKSNPQFWDSVDPQWSQDAATRLGQLKQRIQQAAGVAPAKSLGDAAMDMVTDPSMIAPLGAAKLIPKGTAANRLLNWSTGSSPEPASE